MAEHAIRIFISHAAADKALAEALVTFFATALNILDHEIRCTSVPGHKLRTGAHTSVQLRKDLQTAEVIVGLISSDSITSHYVLFELGAGWGIGKHVVPLMTSDVDYGDLPGPLAERNAVRIDDRDGLQQLIDECANHGMGIRSLKKATTAVEELLRHSEKRKSEPRQGSGSLVSGESNDWVKGVIDRTGEFGFIHSNGEVFYFNPGYCVTNASELEVGDSVWFEIIPALSDAPNRRARNVLKEGAEVVAVVTKRLDGYGFARIETGGVPVSLFLLPTSADEMPEEGEEVIGIVAHNYRGPLIKAR